MQFIVKDISFLNFLDNGGAEYGMVSGEIA